MFRISLIFAFVLATTTLVAQIRDENMVPDFFIQADVNAGLMMVKTSGSQRKLSPVSYPNALNVHTGKLSIKNGTISSYGIGGGCLFKPKHRFGIFTGVKINTEIYSVKLDSFHVEYKNTDIHGSTFRQVVTLSHPSTDKVNLSSISIPLEVMYRYELNKKNVLNFKAGLLFTLNSSASFSTDANFNYEAIYKFSAINGKGVATYDNAATPGSTDWYITKADFLKNNPDGNVNQYFANKNGAGYTVGLNESVGKKNTLSMLKPTMGFIFEAANEIRLRRKLFVNYGVYIIINETQNPSAKYYTSNSMTHSVAGKDLGVTYTSLAQRFGEFDYTMFGANIGLKYYLGAMSLEGF